MSCRGDRIAAAAATKAATATAAKAAAAKAAAATVTVTKLPIAAAVTIIGSSSSYSSSSILRLMRSWIEVVIAITASASIKQGLRSLGIHSLALNRIQSIFARILCVRNAWLSKRSTYPVFGMSSFYAVGTVGDGDRKREIQKEREGDIERQVFIELCPQMGGHSTSHR